MKNLKSCQIVMLPTEKASPLAYDSIDGDIVLGNRKDDVYKSQHLYFVSSDAIKEGEWCIEIHNGESFAPKETPKFTDNEGNVWWLRKLNMNADANSKTVKKIIATTDYLVVKDDWREQHSPDFLPRIPNSFIESFVESYGQIKNVQIETILCENKLNGFDTLIRINLDNTVIIHKNEELGEIPQTKQELLDCIHNLMGAFDSPIARMKIQGNFAEEARKIGREILDKNGKSIYSQ